MTVQTVGPRIQASSTLWKSSQTVLLQRLPQWLGNKESTCEAQATGDAGSIPRSGRCTGGEHGNPFLYSCLGNPMDRGAWRAQVHGVANVIVLLCLCEMILPISSREKKEIPQ